MVPEELPDLTWSIRLASTTDAYRLAEIRNAAKAPGGARDAPRAEREALDFLDRLALPHGEDYFCIVAEAEDRIVGYLIGGGSRDFDRKAHGEIYEVAVLPTSRRRGAARALLADALERFDAAAFAGTLLSAPRDDDVIHRLATSLGMRPDGTRTKSQPTTRYERALNASSKERRTK
jgi:ribosomal protein S18 acetylase RimI-like enzyme